jgi:hypothetical protein
VDSPSQSALLFSYPRRSKSESRNAWLVASKERSLVWTRKLWFLARYLGVRNISILSPDPRSSFRVLGPDVPLFRAPQTSQTRILVGSPTEPSSREPQSVQKTREPIVDILCVGKQGMLLYLELRSITFSSLFLPLGKICRRTDHDRWTRTVCTLALGGQGEAAAAR